MIGDIALAIYGLGFVVAFVLGYRWELEGTETYVWGREEAQPVCNGIMCAVLWPVIVFLLAIVAFVAWRSNNAPEAGA